MADCPTRQHWDEDLDECVDNTEFPAPVVEMVGYTSARIVVPIEDNWPPGVATVDFNIKLATDSTWPVTPVRENLSAENIIILSEDDDILANKTYNFRWQKDTFVSPTTSANTNQGTPGPSTEISIPCLDEEPGIPGPVTFDNPRATSVVCIHRDVLPVRTDTLSLEYRLYTTDNTGEWQVHPTTNFLRNDNILVEELTPSTEYEFRFVAENYLGITYGPAARYDTNDAEDISELIPEAPVLEAYPCPDGKNKILVLLPDLIGTATKQQLQYTTNIAGVWSNFASQLTSSTTEIDVTGLTTNTVYYFRVVQITLLDNEYIGLVSTTKTLPNVPLKPNTVTFGVQTDNSIEIILPQTVDNLDYYILKRGSGSSKDSITWEKEWFNLNPEEHFPDVNLQEDKIYWYKVIAHNECGDVSSELDYIDTHAVKEIPSTPGSVLFDDVQSTRLLVLKKFDYPQRCDNLILYLLDSDKVEAGDEITGSDRTIIKQFILDEEEIIPIFDLDPVNTTFYFQFAAKNKGGTAYGPIAGINTAEDELKLAPLKPEPPQRVGEIVNNFNNGLFTNHTVYIKSPVWSLSSSRPVEGMELWIKEDDEAYVLISTMSLVYEDGSAYGPNSDPWYPFSQAIVSTNLNRARIYTFKVRAFNISESVKQYSTFSDELILNLVSESCVVNLTTPVEDTIVFFKTWITFTAIDAEGHENEQIIIRGNPAQE